MTTVAAFIDHLELRYFCGAEFTPYWTRTRGGFRNSPPPEVIWPNIVPTLVVLDEVREQLGYALILTSTYRSPEYNRAVGGENASYHMRFMAIDFQSVRGERTKWHSAARNLAAAASSIRSLTNPSRSAVVSACIRRSSTSTPAATTRIGKDRFEDLGSFAGHSGRSRAAQGTTFRRR